MSSIDVDELEVRVRRRLALVDARRTDSAPGNARARSEDARSGKGTASLERRLPSDGGVVAQKAASDVATIASACEGIAIFDSLRPEERDALFRAMYRLEYAAGEAVVRQGEEGFNFYVVVAGSAVVTVRRDTDEPSDRRKAHEKQQEQEEEVRTLWPGDTFGEVALLHSVPRSATVRCGRRAVTVWALDRQTFKRTLSGGAFQRREAYDQLLGGVPTLERLDDYDRKRLADAVVPCAFAKGQAICTRGKAEGAKFHIIERGECSVELLGGKEVNRLKPGDYFGEVAALQRAEPTATVVALTGVQTLSLDHDAFVRMLGEDVIDAMRRRTRAYHYATTQDRARAPSTLPKRANTYHGGGVTTTNPGMATGARARIGCGDGGGGGMLAARARLRRGNVSTQDTSSSSSAAAATSYLRRYTERKSSIGDAGARVVRWRDERGRSTVRRRDLSFHKELGVGMSGEVYLARAANLGNAHCCVKVMSKRKLLRLDQAENIMRERALMRSFGDTPFVMQSLCSFQDTAHLYLVMDFMPGGDLFQLLVNGTDKGTFTPPTVVFYASEVLLALEYLHGRGYVYRDLKPENILIDGGGHLKLADLGFCKPLRPGERTYTTCGTSDYMAPEVMLSQGYDMSADYWAFGVLVYEMLAGYAPFQAKTDSQRHRRILTADLRFKDGFQLRAKDLVSKLCVVDTSRRLGMLSGGVDDIKRHAFFHEHGKADWAARARREATPPLMPVIRRAEDMTRGNALKSVARATAAEAPSPASDRVFGEYF